MAEIKLYDYFETVDDGWFGSYEQFFVIGQGKLSAGVVVPLIEAVPEDEEITVKINSVGGFVFDGWAIYNALKAHKGNVTVRIEGLAASIASIIAMSGDNVIICQAAMLMIHKPTVDMFWCGSMDAEALKREAKALDQIQAVLNSVYASKTNLAPDVIDSMINTETWVTPNEAVSLGFANSIDQTITEAQPLAENAFKHIFKNADAKTRAYANTAFNITKNTNMSNIKELTDEVKRSTDASNSLVDWLKTNVKNIFKPKNEDETVAEPVNASIQLEDESYIYYDGELAVDTLVYTDEAMTIAAGDGDHTLMDGRTLTIADGKVTAIADAVEQNAAENAIDTTELEAENAELRENVAALTKSLNASNEVISKLKNTKSTFEPKPGASNFNKPKVNNETGNVDLSPEARAARRLEREEIKNAKNKK